MKVAFDISILGAEERTPENRTGIYKAVEALLKKLILLRKQGLTKDFELTTFSSDLRQLETSKQAWGRVLNDLGASETAFPYRGKDCLNLIQTIALRLHDRKAFRKQKNKFHLLESVVMLVFRPFFKQAFQQWTTTVAKDLLDVDIVHIPFTRDLDKSPSVQGLKRVVTCHDLTPIVCEAHALAKPKEKIKFEAMFNLISTTDFLCCVSASARTDLLAFRPDLNPDNLVVTYLGAETGQFAPITNTDLLQQVRERYGIPIASVYLLSVCTHLPHKNIPFLIRNFLELCVKQSIADDGVLVLCGGKRKFTADMEALLLQYPQYRHRVIVTGYVADDDLPALYSGATGFVLPSLYEGFGLPVLEAMQCGTPVLCSNTASLPEVGGDAALYASPVDDTDFQTQLIALLNNPDLRQQMVEKGFEQAKKFSWEQSAQETLAVYRQAYSANYQ
jgi:glycosyltransferase involved in cell wall biosynthesis